MAKPMKMWLDNEFNGYKGEFISAALVDEAGREWYEVQSNPSMLATPWVAENVMPVLHKQAVLRSELQNSLYIFLKPYSRVHIIVDWPEDISYFCDLLVTGPGERIDTPGLSFEIRRDLPNTSKTSAVPHNALADARALRLSHLQAEDLRYTTETTALPGVISDDADATKTANARTT